MAREGEPLIEAGEYYRIFAVSILLHLPDKGGLPDLIAVSVEVGAGFLLFPAWLPDSKGEFKNS